MRDMTLNAGRTSKANELSRAETIREGLEPGHHVLKCELLETTADPAGGKEFRLISVTSCVPFLVSHVISYLRREDTRTSFIASKTIANWPYSI